MTKEKGSKKITIVGGGAGGLELAVKLAICAQPPKM